jgi:hypothetical protein
MNPDDILFGISHELVVQIAAGVAVTVISSIATGLLGFVVRYLKRIARELEELKDELAQQRMASTKDLSDINRTIAVMHTKDEAQELRIDEHAERIGKLECTRIRGGKR